MKFTEFKERLGAEPRSQGPEMRAARRSDPEFEAAAAEAEEFELRLGGALNVDVDEEAMLASVRSVTHKPSKPHMNWLAMAASVLVLVGVASVAWYGATRPETLDEYLVHHYEHDGAKFLARGSDDFDTSQVNQVLAKFGASASPDLAGAVTYIKICPTLHGKGAHMVVATGNGPVTVIFMPDTQVEGSTLLRFTDMTADVIALESGSAAIISADGQIIEGLEAFLQASIIPVSVDT